MRKNWVKKVITVSLLVMFVEASIASAYYGNQPSNSKPLCLSKTWYVGGNGTGNYTKIQNAIDNASDGDTIIVCHNLSPYYEHISINKKINLTGEAGYRPVIDGNKFGDIINIFGKANYTWIQGFTIQNTSTNGIFVGYDVSNVHIKNNIIKNCKFGIHYWHSDNNVIEGNIIIQNWWGVLLEYAGYNNVGYNNHIENNTMYGILIDSSIFNKIILNDVRNNGRYGIVLVRGSKNEIWSNNFINNGYMEATFENCFNYWSDNYWSDYTKTLTFYIIWGVIMFHSIGDFKVPVFQIDFRPAPIPYDIP